MSTPTAPTTPPAASSPAPALAGRLAENLMHFGRVLRAAGLPLGTDRIALASTALQVAGLESKRDFHAALAACLLDRVEHQALFDQAFDLYWRDPDIAGRMMAMLLPRVQAKPRHETAPPAENRRLADALFPHQPEAPTKRPPPPEQVEVDASLTWNERELLRKADFDTMTADEWRAAQALLRGLPLLAEPVATRRSRRAAHPGRPDGRATLQALARHGGELWQMRWRRPREQPAPLVVLADISGSMSRYSRMLLHFTHAIGHADPHVESFVFGTRLTRTTRALRQRDPDIAVNRVVQQVEDWSGGTRITACLRDFNRHWARRVLGSRATLLLISDGLEHGTPDDPRCEQLAFEMERLHKGCHRLLWLNPLLRFDAFQPRATGIRAMLPHVDRFLPAHNLDSLAALAAVLAGKTPTAGGP